MSFFALSLPPPSSYSGSLPLPLFWPSCATSLESCRHPCQSSSVPSPPVSMPWRAGELTMAVAWLPVVVRSAGRIPSPSLLFGFAPSPSSPSELCCAASHESCCRHCRSSSAPSPPVSTPQRASDLAAAMAWLPVVARPEEACCSQRRHTVARGGAACGSARLRERTQEETPELGNKGPIVSF